MKATFLGVALLLIGHVAIAEDMTVTVSNDGQPVLSLTVAAGSKVTTTKQKTVIDNKEMTLDLWIVPQAKTVADAVASVDAIIKDEFRKYAIDKTEAITIADSEAKHLMGKGNEADDGDPGSADVVIFSVGKTVFAACVHGENDTAARQRKPLLAALKTAKAP